MDKNEEYHVKKEINKLIYNNIEEAFDRVINTSKGTYRTLIAYPLSVLENQYKVYSEVSVLTGFSSMELLLLINPLRQAVFWFIKEILKRNMEFRVEDAFYDFRNKEFGHPFCDFILNLHESYLDMQKLDINRGVARVEFNEIAENKYEIMFPTIKEAYDKEMLYYYGLDDALSSEREREKVIKVDKYLFSIFDAEKLTKYPDRLPGYIEKCDNMLNRTDAKLYRLCKTRVSVDVNKIAEKIESNVIEGKSELISVIALFYYISRLYMQKYMLNVINPLLDGKNMNYCDFHIDQIAKLSERVGICKKTLKRYIEYFSIDPNIEKGGFTEFPFIVQGDHVIWLPSSFLLNDFQFSIVNGHYYKNIHFPKHEETIARSIVDYIINSVRTYSNIIFSSNYTYVVPEEKFNGGDLQSDIDVALYDELNNIMLIIECKWKENVYTYSDDYVKIERAVNEVYKKQLYKHKYFLELDKQNCGKIFDGKIDFAGGIEKVEIFYLFVDKRIQFHNREKNLHVIPTFMLSYLFKKYSEDEALNLKKVIDDIKEKDTRVSYHRKRLVKSMQVEGKIFV